MGLMEIQLASLLHDVGKFERRTGRNKNHATLGEEFCEKYISKDIADIVGLHHHSVEEIPEKVREPVLLLKLCDHISSGEREERGKEEIGDPSSELLLSIFCKINIDKAEPPQEKYYTLSPLMLNRDIFPINKEQLKAERKIWNFTWEYRKLWLRFISEIEKCKKDFETLYYILWKYTWCVPSAVWRDVPDISLFDHLRTTAAIATCLYYQQIGLERLFVLNRSVNVYWKIKRDNADKSASELKEIFKEVVSREYIEEFIEKDNFVLIGGDVSGIQKFIYTMKSQRTKGMAKRLRGRSFYIDLLSESIAHHLLERLSLPVCNLLWCSGGHFFILAPSSFSHRIEEVEREINRVLLREFQGELFVVLGWEPGTVWDMIEFSQFLDKCKRRLAIAKKKKGLSAIVELEDLNITDLTCRGEEKHHTCPICGRDYIGDEREKCGLCEVHEEVGKKLTEMRYLIEVISREKPENCDLIFCFGKGSFIGWKLCKKINGLKGDKIRVFSINSTDMKFSDKYSSGFKFYSGVVPVYKDSNTKQTMDFDALAKFSEGVERISIVRMDLDSLGKIFSAGISETNRTASRIFTLSRMLEMFFSGYLSRIAERFGVLEGKKEELDLCDDCREKLSKAECCEAEIEIQDKRIYTMVLDDNGKPEAELICKKCRQKNNFTPLIYTTYSGGDDVFVVAPYDVGIEFAKELREEFSAYVAGNENLTISAGVFLSKAKFPIARGAKIAGELLDEKSKALPDKNGITVFGESVKWKCNEFSPKLNGFDKLLEFGKKLERDVKSKNISKSFVYSLLSFWTESFSEVSRDRGYIPIEEAERRRSYLPKFKYLLVRNLKRDSPLFQELDKNIPKVMPWMRIPASWALLRNRGEVKWRSCQKI